MDNDQELIARLHEIAHRDSAVSVTVQTEDLRTLLSKLRAPVADAVPVKASNIDTRDVDVEVHAFGSIFYDHGPNLAEALGRLAQRVARWRNLPATSLASAPVAGNNMRNPNLSRQGGWIKTDGFCDFLILAGIIGAIVGGILIPEVISFLWDFAKPWIHEVTK